jgi:mono/diheme cytochrome c family protein
MSLEIRLPAATLLLAAAAAGGAYAAEPPTFNRDVAPLVFANCAPCHRPGEAGPFSLLSYADVKSHARQIVAVTAKRFMPPWLPEPGLRAFLGERRLTDAQIELLRLWVEAGAPEGDPADLPPAPRFTEGWALGEPDLVLETPRPFPLSPDGTDVFWNLVYRPATTRTRYVRAVEIRLNDRRVGHHANLLVDRAGAARRRDGSAAVVGFPGMDVSLESAGFDPDSHFLFWKPGTMPYEERKGMAWPLEPSTDLVLNMHLRPPSTSRPGPGTSCSPTSSCSRWRSRCSRSTPTPTTWARRCRAMRRSPTAGGNGSSTSRTGT